jgi:hypothetical protein
MAEKNPAKTAYSLASSLEVQQLAPTRLTQLLEVSKGYAKAHGLKLADFPHRHDLGVSAYRGVKPNPIARFLNAVTCGSIAPGSVLLVESFEGVPLETAMEGLVEIVRHGITIVMLPSQPSA